MDLQEHLLCLAERLIAERGLQEIAIEDLAREAGLDTPSAQAFFPSHRRLLLEVVGFLLQEIRAAWEVGLQSSPHPTMQLLQAIHETARVFERRARILPVILQAVRQGDALDPTLKAQVQGLWELLVPSLHHAVPLIAGDPQIAAILGPALLCLMASHFLVRPLVERPGTHPFDTAFYAKYPHVIADMAVTGLIAVGFNAREGKYACHSVPQGG